MLFGILTFQTGLTKVKPGLINIVSLRLTITSFSPALRFLMVRETCDPAATLAVSDQNPDGVPACLIITPGGEIGQCRNGDDSHRLHNLPGIFLSLNSNSLKIVDN
jgi:hypothetical protein